MEDIKFTLKKRKASRHDYSFHKSHNLGAIVTPDFLIPSSFPEQNGDKCTAFSSVAARDSEVPGNFDPEQFWNDELSFAGVASSDGFDIEVPAAVGVKTGFTPVGSTVRGNKVSAYFWIHSNNGRDLFDSVLSAVYVSKYPAIGGLDFYNEWVNVPQGIISSMGQSLLGGHAIRIAAKKTVNGIPYAGLPNTWGTNYGEGGMYWMTREVFNQVFAEYGVFVNSDNPNVRIKTLGLIQALYKNILILLKIYGHYTGYPPPVPTPVPKPTFSIYDWTTHDTALHSTRLICDAMGLPYDQKNVLCACVEVESAFNPQAVHPNKSIDGKILSVDYGICQINSYWNIGIGKPFPTSEYVLANPEKCIRWMCSMFLEGKQSLWCSYTSGAYKKYL